MAASPAIYGLCNRSGLEPAIQSELSEVAVSLDKSHKDLMLVHSAIVPYELICKHYE